MRFLRSGYTIAILGFIFLPWMLASMPIWEFSRSTFIVPLSADLFDLSFVLFDHHRVVIPHWLVHPLLILYSFLGPALLAVFFILLTRALRALSFGFWLAILGTGLVYLDGAPGTTPHQLLEYSFLLLCLNPLTTPLSPLKLWALSAIVLFLSKISEQNEFLIFWSTLSLSVGFLIHYILAEKAILPKRMRDQFVVTSFTAFGLSCLAVSILYLSLDGALQHDLVQTTPNHWWIAWILGILSVLLCWLKPWETHRWISFAIFGHGIFFCPALAPSLWAMIAFVSLSVLDHLLPHARIARIPLPKLKPGHKVALLAALSLTLSIYIMRTFRPTREFRPGWVSLMHETRESPAKGYLVIGSGASFLAHFSSAKFISDPTALTLDSEEALTHFMNQEGVDEIIVDADYMTRFWKSWINENEDTEVANRSVITRLVRDGGKEVRLRTINLDTLKEFKSVPAKAARFYFISQVTDEAREKPAETP